MKLNKSGQLMLVSAASLVVAGLLTACGTLTVDFVYVTSSKAAGPNSYGEVDVFEVNSESGFMHQIPTSPFPSGGRNPVAEAVSTDYKNLYVVNRDDNTIVQFTIGNDGKLYPQNTVNTPGIYPIATALSGSTLFVADSYEPLPTCSSASPCSGSVGVFPLSSSGAPGTPVANGSRNYWPLSLPGKTGDVLLPTAISVLGSGSELFVTTYDTTANSGYVFAFSVSSGGALTALNGGAPFAAGIHPSALAADPSGQYLYVADISNGTVHSFAINSGLLSEVAGSPFPSGGQTSAITVDSAGKYVYAANAQDSTVTAFSASSGVLSRLGSYATDTQPVAIVIDPSKQEYVYTANFLGSTVSGFKVDASAGTLFSAQNTPYVSNAQPTAMAAIPHGAQKK